MAKQSAQQKSDAADAKAAEDKAEAQALLDKVQSPAVEPEKVGQSVVVPPVADPAGLADAKGIRSPEKNKKDLPEPAAKMEQFNSVTHIVVNKKLFNKMITSLALNKGLMFYTGNGLITQVGEMFGMKKEEPGFYEKARTLLHNIMVEHQKV